MAHFTYLSSPNGTISSDCPQVTWVLHIYIASRLLGRPIGGENHSSQLPLAISNVYLTFTFWGSWPATFHLKLNWAAPIQFIENIITWIGGNSTVPNQAIQVGIGSRRGADIYLGKYEVEYWQHCLNSICKHPKLHYPLVAVFLILGR